jgi:hypothetical protein
MSLARDGLRHGGLAAKIVIVYTQNTPSEI